MLNQSGSKIMNTPIKCPSCGGNKFAITTEAKSYDDLIGAVCPDCGHTLTDEEIKEQARELAIKLAKEAFKKGRL